MRRGGVFGDLAFFGKLAEGDVFAVSEEESNGSYRNKGNQPEHDAATKSQFLAEVEEGGSKNAYDGELRATADTRKLDDGSSHAGSHDEQHVGVGHVMQRESLRALWIGVHDLKIGERNADPDPERDCQKSDKRRDV